MVPRQLEMILPLKLCSGFPTTELYGYFNQRINAQLNCFLFLNSLLPWLLDYIIGYTQLNG